jgi:hypothetical protein
VCQFEKRFQPFGMIASAMERTSMADTETPKQMTREAAARFDNLMGKPVAIADDPARYVNCP